MDQVYSPCTSTGYKLQLCKVSVHPLRRIWAYKKYGQTNRLGNTYITILNFICERYNKQQSTKFHNKTGHLPNWLMACSLRVELDRCRDLTDMRSSVELMYFFLQTANEAGSSVESKSTYITSLCLVVNMCACYTIF